MARETTGSQAVVRALDLLMSFGPEDSGFSLSDLSERVGLTPSTTRRLLKALMANGFIEQDPHSRRYRLGMQLTRLGHIAERQSELGRLAGTVMRGLVKESDEAAYLSRLVGGEVLYLKVVHTEDWDRLTAEVGQTYEAWATASGRVLLAEKGDDEIDAMHPEVLPEFRGRERITRERLKRELEVVRQTGFAAQLSEEEHEVFSYAAPVFDGSGIGAMALAVSGPSHRAPEPTRLVPKLKWAAAEISYRIGGHSRASRYAANPR